VYLRIWNQDGSPEGIAVQKLYSAVSAMNKVLTAAHLRHPRLAAINSNVKIETTHQDSSNILREHADSWFLLLRKADDIILPRLEEYDADIICACLSSDVTSSLKMAASLMQSSKKSSAAYDDLARTLSCSILSSEVSTALHSTDGTENRIGGLLDELYPPSI